MSSAYLCLLIFLIVVLFLSQTKELEVLGTTSPIAVVNTDALEGPATYSDIDDNLTSTDDFHCSQSVSTYNTHGQCSHLKCTMALFWQYFTCKFIFNQVCMHPSEVCHFFQWFCALAGCGTLVMFSWSQTWTTCF